MKTAKIIFLDLIVTAIFVSPVLGAFTSTFSSPIDIVIGQANKTTNVQNQPTGLSANSLNQPMSGCMGGSKLIVADTMNNRVLIFNSLPTASNTPADVVIGQADFIHNGVNQGLAVGANTMQYPRGVWSDGTRLIVTDTSNHRVLIYNNIPTTNNANADVVLGQANFTTNAANSGGIKASTLNFPQKAWSDGTKLYIADTNNSRVLIFNSIPTTNFASADVVVGQANFTTATSNTGGIAANRLYYPYKAWTSGSYLFIADAYNNRTLMYFNIPITNNASADVVLGQPNFTTSTAGVTANKEYNPTGGFCDGTKLYICDNMNNRVLIYNAIPTVSNAAPDVVIGQFNFTTSTVQTSGGVTMGYTLYYPYDVSILGTKLLITEYYDNRAILFNSIPTVSGTPADVAIGQVDLSHNGANQPEGIPTANRIPVPNGVFISGSKLIAADQSNNRVLIFNTIPAADNASADLVIGQPNLSSGAPNGGVGAGANTLSSPRGIFVLGAKLFVADAANNRVLIYNNLPTANNAAADVVIGQANFTSGLANQGGAISASGLNTPVGVCSDGIRLFIVEYGNHRVLIYNTIPTANNAAADLVIGQANMSTNISSQTGCNAKTLYQPSGIWYYGGKLFVADYQDNRVLIYNTIPTANNAAADVVVGQPNMTQNANFGATQTQLNRPTAVYADGSRLFVCDSLNSRIVFYNTLPTVNYTPASGVIGQASYTANAGALSATNVNLPVGLFSNGSKLLISDGSSSRRILSYDILATPFLTLTVDSISQITSSWNYQSAIPTNSFILLDGSNNQIANLPNTSNTNVETGLNTNTQYKRKLQVWDGVEVLTSDAISRYTLADVPAILTAVGSYDATNGYNCQITLNRNTNPVGTYYAVTPDNGTNWLQANGSAGPTTYWSSAESGWLYRNLAAGTTYTFNVKAKNGDNVETALSAGVSATTTVHTAPTVIPTLTVTSDAISRLLISWLYVDQTSISGFRVLDVLNNLIADLPPTVFATVEAGLAANTAYTTKVNVWNDLGFLETPVITRYTLADNPAIGTAVGSFNPTNGYNCVIGVNRNTNPAGATNYAITPDNGTNWLQADGTAGSLVYWSTAEAGWLYKNLASGTTYTFMVKAKNGDNLETVLSPGLVATTPPSLSATAASISSLNYSWNTSGAAGITGFTLIDTLGTLIQALPAGTATATETGLLTNMQYSRQLQMQNVSGLLTSEIVSCFTLADVPAIATAVGTYDAVNGYNCQVSVNRNTNPVGTLYAITPDTGFNWLQGDGTISPVVYWSSAEAGWIYNNLKQGTSYAFQVKAKNGDNLATALSARVSTTTPSLAIPIIAPTLIITSDAVNRLLINWNYVDATAISGFKLLDAANTVLQNLPASANSTIGWGLSTNTVYGMKVQAWNSLGSIDSAVVYRYTLAEVPAVSSVVPGYDALNGYNCKITLNRNTNPAGTNYAVSPDNGTNWLQADGTAGPTAYWSSLETGWLYKNLPAGTTYTFTAKAKNGDNVETTLSAGVGAMTSATPPPPLSHTINALAGANGTISPAGLVTTSELLSLTFTIVPNTNYSIQDVRVDGFSQGTINTYAFNGITSNHTIEATFGLNAYVVTATAGPNGKITPSGSVGFIAGSNNSFTLTPDFGYQVADVKVDGVSQGAITSYTFTNVLANHAIEATFELAKVMAPTDLTIVSESTTTQRINWHNQALNPTMHHIEKSIDGITYAEIGTVAGAVNTYLGSGSIYLMPNTKYWYRIRTEAGGLYSAYTMVGPTFTLAAAPSSGSYPLIASTKILAVWNAAGNPGGTAYYCEDQSAGAGWWTAALSWESKNLDPGSSHNFRIKAKNGDGAETAWLVLGPVTTQAKFASIDVSENGIKLLEGDIVSGQPVLSVTAVPAPLSAAAVGAGITSNSIDAGTFRLYLDDKLVTDGINKYYDKVSTNAGKTIFEYTPKQTLRVGTHKIKVVFSDTQGNAFESSYSVKVMSGVGIASEPLCYPNPYDPLKGNVRISYTLTTDTGLTVYIYDAYGNLTSKNSYAKSAPGGTAGYNEITWDGKDLFGNFAPNNVYLIRIVDSSNGNMLGKTKLAIYKGG